MNASTAEPDTRTRLLDAALRVIRTKGYGGSTVDDICHEASLSKGAFFHHFASKEELGIAAAAYFSERAEALFGAAPYRAAGDPRDRLLGYIDQRSALLSGELPDFTCLLGTMVQETYATHPAIRAACDAGLRQHTADVATDIADARAALAPAAPWTSESLGHFVQAVMQGSFILAKAYDDPGVAADCLTHLRRYVEDQLPASTPASPTTKGR